MKKKKYAFDENDYKVEVPICEVANCNKKAIAIRCGDYYCEEHLMEYSK